MRTTFDLADKLKAYSKKVLNDSAKLRKGIEKNAEIACRAMEETAKAHTPHSGDGKKRGWNVISDSLQNSWVAEYKPSKSKKLLGKVILTNNKSYAPYVQYGHRLTKHFVPWLYKDSMGTLSYETNHAQPLFGLVVGTKTPYVKGVDMIGPAEKEFERVFYELNKELIKKIFK